jgi:hypothetical protein
LRSAFSGLLLVSVVVWHALATTLAPYPGSRLKAAVYPWLEPYLEALWLEHDWRFFGPQPAAGRLLRVRIIDAAGAEHEIRLTEAERRESPLFFRHLRLWDAVGPTRPETTRSVSLHLCRTYDALAPHSVQLVRMHQFTIDDEQYRSGVRPLDPLALGAEPLEPVECPAPSQSGVS